MKKSRIIIITVIITLLVVSVVAIVYKVKTGASSKPTVVRIEKAQRGELIEFVSAPGEIEPRVYVKISAKVSARIIELPYEEGDIVTCGSTDTNPPVPASVLLRLDDKDLQSRLLSAEASYAAQAAQLEVEKARIAGQQANLIGLDASLKQAQRDLERQKGLLESQDISQATFDQSKLRFDELKSQYDSAKHTLDAAELNLVVMQHNLEASGAGVTQAKETLSYTTITSPIDGVVTRINAETGEMVIPRIGNNPGNVIMEVADLSAMLVVAQVDEADVGKLRVGQAARAHIQAWPDKVFPGRVRAIALSNQRGIQGSKYYEAEILLLDPNEQIFTGMTADVDIEVAEHKDVLTIPSQAVLGKKVDELPIDIRDKLTDQERQKSFATVVFCYNDGKALISPVKIGPSNPTHTVIEAGITQADSIVVGPYKELEKLKHEQLIKDEREVKAEQEAKKKKADPNAGNDMTDVNKF